METDLLYSYLDQNGGFGFGGEWFVKLSDILVEDHSITGVVASPLLVELTGVVEVPGRVSTDSGVAVDLSFAGGEELREVRRVIRVL